MIVYFADRYLNIIGQASTTLPKGLKIIDDIKTEDVDTGVATFEFTLPYGDKKAERAFANKCTAVGNYILRRSGTSDKVDEFYTIIESEEDAKNTRPQRRIPSPSILINLTTIPDSSLAKIKRQTFLGS